MLLFGGSCIIVLSIVPMRANKKPDNLAAIHIGMRVSMMTARQMGPGSRVFSRNPHIPLGALSSLEQLT